MNALTAASSPPLGFVRYVPPVAELTKPTRSAPAKLATALLVVTVSDVPFATICAAAGWERSDRTGRAARSRRWRRFGKAIV
jgi:hypothetical protein